MRRTGPPQDVVELVLVRDGHCCVVCGVPVHGAQGWDYSVHHRRPRGMGGTRRRDTNSPVNLLLVCGSGTAGCHGAIESRRADSHRNGWLVFQSADPAQVPVLVAAQSRWTYLTTYGTYSDEPEER